MTRRATRRVPRLARRNPPVDSVLLRVADSDLRRARREGELMVAQTKRGTLILRHSDGVYELRTAGTPVTPSVLLARGKPSAVRHVLAGLYQVSYRNPREKGPLTEFGKLFAYRSRRAMGYPAQHAWEASQEARWSYPFEAKARQKMGAQYPRKGMLPNPPRAYAHLGYSRDWPPKFKAGDSVVKILHVGPFDIKVRGKVVTIRPMGSGRLGSASFEPHYDVQWSRISKGDEAKLLRWSKKTLGREYIHPGILEPGFEDRVPERYLKRPRGV